MAFHTKKTPFYIINFHTEIYNDISMYFCRVFQNKTNLIFNVHQKIRTMGIFKKFRAEFKEQSLLSKIRILFVTILLVAVVATAGIVGILLSLDWGSRVIHHHTVKKTQPISGTYSLCTYKDYSYQLVVTETQRKIGPRFHTMRDDNILTDSVIFLYGEKGCQTFSLKTGIFSEEYFDNIENPDTLHHLAACSRKGMLGFLNVHSGKLVIPLKFCAIDNYSAEILLEYPHPLWDNSIPLDFNEANIDIVDEMPACESCCGGECVMEETVQDPVCDYHNWRKKESTDGTIQFAGNYCIVPTTTSTYGVIDTTGKIIIDGYESITHYLTYNLFKAYKNKKFDLYTADAKCLLSQRKSISVLPQGIFHPGADILTNHTCTDTLTNLVMRGYRPYLDEYGYGEYHNAYYDRRDYYVISVTFDDDDNDESWWIHNTKYGAVDAKTGKTVIEPVWDDVDVYTDKKGNYIFKCSADQFSFLLDKNGNFLNRK